MIKFKKSSSTPKEVKKKSNLVIFSHFYVIEQILDGSFWMCIDMYINIFSSLFSETPPSSWTQEINWIYIRHSEDFLDLVWTSCLLRENCPYSELGGLYTVYSNLVILKCYILLYFASVYKNPQIYLSRAIYHCFNCNYVIF